ncbi:hypothetical protein NDU88_003310 [Pleurodeles waltl]|uniref:Uncharacterized protein n=1 Tax=Pleurodeles waltl TaxID=8319 RepID=A0AAV7RDZ5_PLEWA|nr:hypothetical protein NDU88_003310 [Pleurodeles waltl]
MLTNAASYSGLRLPTATVCHASALTSHPIVPIHRHRPLGLARRRMNPRVYRPLVDLSTMEERHIILRYCLDRATIHELCAQMEPALMSPIRQPT